MDSSTLTAKNANAKTELKPRVTNASAEMSYQFEAPSEPAPPSVDDEARRREEEELQLALGISMRDKGGRSTYAPTASAGSSGTAAKYTSGKQSQNARKTSGYPAGATSGGVLGVASSSTSSLPSQVSAVVVTRFRALHTFEPTEPDELAFEKGEVIKVEATKIGGEGN
ncbi:hypothetical protein EDB19DRAFT_2038243 [Suillus lakei]|nr:hypothetical protein EDB19DRAFT_2038243 [Suillus lakei]